MPPHDVPVPERTPVELTWRHDVVPVIPEKSTVPPAVKFVARKLLLVAFVRTAFVVVALVKRALVEVRRLSPVIF